MIYWSFTHLKVKIPVKNWQIKKDSRRFSVSCCVVKLPFCIPVPVPLTGSPSSKYVLRSFTRAPGHSSTWGRPRHHSPLWGQGLLIPNPLHLLWRSGLGYPVLLNLWAPHRGLSHYTRRLWAGNCCLQHSFSPVLEPHQGGDICSLAGLTWPHVIFSSSNVLLAVQAWGTPSTWRHVGGRWVISEPCQYIPCPLLPTTSSRVFSARHYINA